jgi:glutathione S-transferase
MAAKLFQVHGSHPCAAVRKALDLKGIDYKLVEFPPPFHMPYQRLRTGSRTVPSVKLDDGEVVSGSSAILRRLDQLVPEPPLFGSPAVEEAERWGEGTLQPIARSLLWGAFGRSPASMVGYQQGGKLPPLPKPVVLALAPLIGRVERKVNNATEEQQRADLAALPGYLDVADGYIADGTIGGATPNAADLQIASTLRLLMTLRDIGPLIESRPAGQLALRIWPDHPGEVPAGTFPADWVPANSASSAASLAG